MNDKQKASPSLIAFLKYSHTCYNMIKKHLEVGLVHVGRLRQYQAENKPQFAFYLHPE